ncbi:hypothetical protein JTE90_013645 [Oedothorax gibbosus]|uniref:THAP-type domain-containing protein n=1 Tax=Oedothorax gibbosus TaxID=931172 RepID=A0AAV6TU65_9ARAC|nr:hypothetical protein JTE90_013645 [Oedothorax gibbosus]
MRREEIMSRGNAEAMEIMNADKIASFDELKRHKTTKKNWYTHTDEQCISFFKVSAQIPPFPSLRPEVLQKWVEAVDVEGFQATKTHRICSVHFEDDNFQFGRRDVRKCLKEDACPTRFLRREERLLLKTQKKSDLNPEIPHKSAEKDVGVEIHSVTCDGTSTNIGTLKKLGCNFELGPNFRTHFINPSSGLEVFVFLDPCHMLKLARNALPEKGTILSNEGIVRNTVSPSTNANNLHLETTPMCSILEFRSSKRSFCLTNRHRRYDREQNHQFDNVT